MTFAAESSMHPHVSARRPARFPGMRAAGKAGALMAGRAVRETVTLGGRAERARLARAFVEGVLGPGHPCGDVAALLVGELFSNSLSNCVVFAFATLRASGRWRFLGPQATALCQASSIAGLGAGIKVWVR